MDSNERPWISREITWVSMGVHWSLMGSGGYPLASMGFHGRPWVSLWVLMGFLWAPVGSHRRLLVTGGLSWAKPAFTNGFPTEFWVSVVVHGCLEAPVGSHWNPFASFGSHRRPRVSHVRP